MTGDKRKPAAFRLQPEKKPARAKKPRKRAPKTVPAPEIQFDPEPEIQPNLPQAPDAETISSTIKWGALALSAIASLFALWLGVTLTNFIETLYQRSPLLGMVGFGLLILALMAAFAIFLREIFGLMRLRKLGSLQELAQRAKHHNDAEAATQTLKGLRSIYGDREDAAWGLAALRDHEKDIVDPRDLITLAERDLLETLDEDAGRIISSASRKVTVMTAVAPTALLDIAFVAVQNMKMLRALATLYGGRPGNFGTLKLARMVIAHLALTGGLALTDNLIQQVVGKGMVGRLSARFGEGAMNGILTARVGLAALDLTRPIPFGEANRPSLPSLLKTILGLSDSANKNVKSP